MGLWIDYISLVENLESMLLILVYRVNLNW